MPSNRVFGTNAPTPPYGPDPRPGKEGKELVQRRHREWTEWRLRWQFLLDSYEGGFVYAAATYGYDLLGYPVRNLIRHKFEYDPPDVTSGNTGGFQGPPIDPGADPSKYATNNDYELRRARTPVPTFFREAVETHLSKVFSKEVTRKGPADLEAWWADVDGRGTPVCDWMENFIAPIGMTLANLDVLFDHPAAPLGGVANQADAKRLRVAGVVASVILPENMVWWRLDARDRYAECLVREWTDDAIGNPVECFRHWTAEWSRLYDADGGVMGEPVDHPFGRPPIVRLFDQKRPRLRNVGQSRYEGIAVRQREFYNRDSEAVLADTLQVHCLIQGPEDFVQSDGNVPIGPAWMLPKKKNTSGTTASYEGFEVLNFPSSGADSLRANKQEIRDAVDRDAKLTKPAGTSGTNANSVSQSGVSKKLDNQDGGQLLMRIKSVIEGWERTLAETALLVLHDGDPPPAEAAAVEITYPVTFDLQSFDELSAGSAAFQLWLEGVGAVPEIEKLQGSLMIRELMPGQTADVYRQLEDDLNRLIDRKAGEHEQLAEARAEAPPLPVGGPAGLPDASAEEDPFGSDGAIAAAAVIGQ